MIVLHLSPHPDDEALGAPATLRLLQRAGWHVVNAVVSLGRPADRARRRREATDASARADFELALPDETFVMPRDEVAVAAWITSLVREHSPTLVISPSSHDGHPSHEAVARAAGAALASRSDPPPWWVWGLWADLPSPTIYVPFDDVVLADAHHVLAAYAGELARNDYARLLDARSVANAVLGSERVFGFGSARASTLPYAELLGELRCSGGEWHPGVARMFDAADPLAADAPAVSEATNGRRDDH